MLRVYINRVRNKLGAPGAIVIEGGLYHLGRYIDVDIEQLERAVRSARNMSPMTDRARTSLHAWLDHFRGTLLARDALGRNDFHAVLQLGRRIVELYATNRGANLSFAHILPKATGTERYASIARTAMP